MHRIKRVINWLNLLDLEGKLSLTNVALVALVIKMLVSPNLDWPAVVTLITVFANYMHKRQAVNGQVEAEKADEMKAVKEQYDKAVLAQAQAITDLNAKLQQVSQALNFSNLIKKNG